MVPSCQGWRSISERPRLRSKWGPLSLMSEDWWGGRVGGSLFQACPPGLEEIGPNFMLCHVST